MKQLPHSLVETSAVSIRFILGSCHCFMMLHITCHVIYVQIFFLSTIKAQAKNISWVKSILCDRYHKNVEEKEKSHKKKHNPSEKIPTHPNSN